MYSLDFAIEVSRICMDEIRRRGLTERKILRKSEPNNVLIIKVFRKNYCTPEDLTYVSIHSVATIMQDTLWCCRERILPRKVWRVINYETCTLEELSQFISAKGASFLVEILDFLVEVMHYKDINQMSAYYLGQAIGQSILGPTDCDTIIAEKASHFLTRMIIEHSKNYKNAHKGARGDGLKKKAVTATERASTPVTSTMSKAEATRAKAKSYNRIIRQIRNRNRDWLSVTNQSLYALLENDFEEDNASDLDEPYVSIFSTDLDPSRAITSPILYKLVSEASKPVEIPPQDPFANSTLFNSKRHPKGSTPAAATTIESQLSVAFNDFAPLTKKNYFAHLEELERSTMEQQHHSRSHMKMINSSLSNMKLKLKKDRSQFAAAPLPPLPPSSTTTDRPPVIVPVIHNAVNSYDVVHSRRSRELISTPHPLNTASSLSSTIEEETDSCNTDHLSNRTLYSNSLTDEHTSNNSSSNMKSSRKQMKGMMRKAFKLGAIAPSKRAQAATSY